MRSGLRLHQEDILQFLSFRSGQPRQIDQITNLEYNYICAVAKDLYNATATLEAMAPTKIVTSTRRSTIAALPT